MKTKFFDFLIIGVSFTKRNDDCNEMPCKQVILYVYNTYFLPCFIGANLPRNFLRLLIFILRMRKEKLYNYLFFNS